MSYQKSSDKQDEIRRSIYHKEDDLEVHKKKQDDSDYKLKRCREKLKMLNDDANNDQKSEGSVDDGSNSEE